MCPSVARQPWAERCFRFAACSCAAPIRKIHLLFHGQKAIRRKAFLCLYACRCCNVFAHLLCSSKTIFESDGHRIGVHVSKLKRRSLEQREAKPSVIADEHSPPALSRAPQARRSRLLLTALVAVLSPAAKSILLQACLLYASLSYIFRKIFCISLLKLICRFANTRNKAGGAAAPRPGYGGMAATIKRPLMPVPNKLAVPSL